MAFPRGRWCNLAYILRFSPIVEVPDRQMPVAFEALVATQLAVS